MALSSTFRHIIRRLSSASAATISVDSCYKFQPPTQGIVNFENDNKDGMLSVVFENGLLAKFPHVWLRDNAPEPNTYQITDKCRARVMLMADLDTNVRPQSVNLNKTGGLNITWPGVNGGQATSVTYNSDWLKERNFGDATFRESRHEYHYDDWKAWDAPTIKEKIVKNPTDFERLFIDDGYLLQEMEKFMSYGFLHVINVPRTNNQILRFTNRMGYEYHTHYGPNFDVKTFIEPSNLAYTNRELGLHTDLPQCMTPPHIQILHAIDQSEVGGDNQFCDGIRVAEQLKEFHPEAYKLLSTVKIEYPDWGQDKHRYIMLGKWPVIDLDKSGEIKAIYYNNQLRGWFVDTDSHTCKRVYDALKLFNDYCYSPSNMLQIKLNAGEMVMFANNRVLHGRSQFTVKPGESGERYYHGGYILFDPVRSAIRTLRESLGIKRHTAI